MLLQEQAGTSFVHKLLRERCFAQDTHPHSATQTFRDELNVAAVVFTYIWNSVFQVLALWFISITFAEEERSSRVCFERCFPRASGASCEGRFTSHQVCSARDIVGSTTESGLRVQAVRWSFQKVLSAKPSPLYINSLFHSGLEYSPFSIIFSTSILVMFNVAVWSISHPTVPLVVVIIFLSLKFLERNFLINSAWETGAELSWVPSQCSSSWGCGEME